MNTIYESKDYKIKILKENHELAELQSLFRNCSDYYDLHGGEGMGLEGALATLKAGPVANKDEDKFSIGLFRKENLIGVIEGIKNCPDEGSWFIGQMLVDIKKRSSGLGASFFDEFQGWAQDIRVERLWLAVMSKNVLAEKFWKRRGFEFVEDRSCKDLGSISSDLKVYEKKVKVNKTSKVLFEVFLCVNIFIIN